MDGSRRTVLGGIATAGALGVIGFAGAASVSEDGDTAGSATDSPATEPGEDDTTETPSVPAATDAPFEAHLLESAGEGTTPVVDSQLFAAAELDRVQGVIADGNEHLVYLALTETGIDSLQRRLTDAGAAEHPERFAVSMTLDDAEVRRVDLDTETVTALTDSEWSGVVTLPFDQASVADKVYESLAAT